MPSSYLQGGDLDTYGVPNATEAQINQASSLIDGYLQRPEGLIWMPDAIGNPCYMQNLVAIKTLVSQQSISPGQNVVVNVTGPLQAITLGSSQCGLVAILDRTNTNATEACIVNAVTIGAGGAGTVTLSNVQFPHEINTLLEFDLVIFEEHQMPKSRPLTNLYKTPVQIVLGGQGRYGYSRRGNSNFLQVDEFNLLAAITQFGGPPIWEIFNQSMVGVDPNTGQVWFPAGIMLAYYTEIRVSYIAGYTYASLPANVKQACANIITAMIRMPMNGAIQSQRAGDTAITRFAATYFDNDTKALLQQYMARLYV